MPVDPPAGAGAGLRASPGSLHVPQAWTVAQVNRRARALLEHGVPALWVRGEVADWYRSMTGHRYFTLKDASAQIDAVMFQSDARRLPVDPAEGTRVRAFGSVTVYEARGKYQIRVRRLEAEDGDGLWRAAFERARRRVEAAGLTDPRRKRPVPPFPACVGVVTSPKGAALQDILSVIGARAPWTRVLLGSARVQGEGAAREVAEAVGAIGRHADVVIVARGGGSMEDLWAFNREQVARAIASCPVPVISAVGHETDLTIADLVADLRAPTPSAGAEAAVPDRTSLKQRLAEFRPRLSSALRRYSNRYRDALDERSDRVLRAMRRVVEQWTGQVAYGRERLDRAMRAAAAARRARLERISARLHALSPLQVLRRGYSVAVDDSGRVLRGVSAFVPKAAFDLRVVDGRVRCRVAEVAGTDELTRREGR